MATGFCLIPTLADKFLTKLRKGEIDPAKLADMTSKERRDFFSEFLGEENAKKVNAQFESKLLLKNQQQGIINWAKQVARLKPEVQRDILAKAERMTEILQPKEMDAFLEDLASQKIGISITAEEGGKIADLAKYTAEKKTAWDGKKWTSREAQMEYGRAKKAFGDYIGELKLEADKPTISDRFKNPVKTLSEVGGIAKSSLGTLDDSALFRQGLKTLQTHPVIWLKNAALSFKDIAQTIGGKEVQNEVVADIISRPNSMNGLYKREKLALGNVEEAFPSSIPEKVPGIGRLFKASETAYKSFLLRTRADVFDKYIEIANKTGADITGIGRLVNSLTGRGHLGGLEPAANTINNLFFSPRFVKSQFDVLSAHILENKENFGQFARKQAAKNLLKIVGSTAAVLAIAHALHPDAVELDPRSSDFGKIKIGDTRFDVTGGASSLVTLAVRTLPLVAGQDAYTKNSKGELVKLNAGAFTSRTGLDVVEDFIEGKSSPLLGAFLNQLKGENSRGEKPTLGSVAKDLFVPLPIQNAEDLMTNPKAAPPLLGVLLDAVGIGASTRSNTPKIPTLQKDTEVYNEIKRLAEKDFKPTITNFDSPTGRLLELQQKVTSEEYNKAKDAYLSLYNEKVTNFLQKDVYKNAPLDVKQKHLNDLNTKIMDKVLHDFGYRQEKPVHTPDN